MRIILFTGKGGVGKTTLSAATGLHCAQRGARALVVSTDIAHSLADALQCELNSAPTQIGDAPFFASELDTSVELERYWGDIRRRIASGLIDEGMDPSLAGELAILPGLDEILALVRIKQLYSAQEYDLLIIDSAPTGAAMRLLAAPDLQRWYTQHLSGLSRSVSRLLLPSLKKMINLPVSEGLIQNRIGRIFDQVKELQEILTDADATSVRLVLNPEHLSVQETQRAYTYMSLYGLGVDSLFVNRLLPSEVEDPYFQQWKKDQARYSEAVEESFTPLPVFYVPLMRSEVLGVKDLKRLAAELYQDIDPIKRLCQQKPLRFYQEDGYQVMALRLSGVATSSIDLNKRGNELRVQLGSYRRSLYLPQSLASLEPAWARVDDNELKIAFREAEPEA